LPTKTESDQRRIKAVVSVIQELLSELLSNSFEIVIRDDETLKDHIYDAEIPELSNKQNYKVRKNTSNFELQRFDLIDLVVMQG